MCSTFIFAQFFTGVITPPVYSSRLESQSNQKLVTHGQNTYFTQDAAIDFSKASMHSAQSSSVIESY